MGPNTMACRVLFRTSSLAIWSLYSITQVADEADGTIVLA